MLRCSFFFFNFGLFIVWFFKSRVDFLLICLRNKMQLSILEREKVVRQRNGEQAPRSRNMNMINTMSLEYYANNSKCTKRNVSLTAQRFKVT